MLMYFIILFAKIIEVSMMTLRTVLITKGQKGLGAIIGFFEVSIWLIIVGKVLNGIQEDPMKMVVYALGFSVGNYLGAYLEEKLAIGLTTMRIIVPHYEGEKIVQKLRDNNYGVTIVHSKGIEEKNMVLLIHTKRKNINHITNIVLNETEKVVITTSDTNIIYGGYGLGFLRK